MTRYVDKTSKALSVGVESLTEPIKETFGEKLLNLNMAHASK